MVHISQSTLKDHFGCPNKRSGGDARASCGKFSRILDGYCTQCHRVNCNPVVPPTENFNAFIMDCRLVNWDMP